MRQVSIQQAVRLLVLVPMLSLPVSLLAEDRSDWRTQGDRYERRGDRSERRGARSDRYDRGDLSGVVVSVNPNGDSFVLRTGNRSIHLDARGGVGVYYDGRRYRVRDLERGDRVAVDLSSSRGRYGARVQRVEVLRSASSRFDRYDDSYDYGRSRGKNRRRW